MKALTIIGGIFVASALMLGSCTKNTYNYDDGDRTRIVLSSQVELGTPSRLNDLQIYPGQSLGFFVTGNGDTDNVLYNNQQITANGSGGFTYTQNMYYPDNGNAVDFYSIHPYIESATLERPVTVSVPVNQNVQSSYLNADVLWATKDDVEPTTSAVQMAFSHKMTKLDFTIIEGNGTDISTLNTVTALGLLPTTTLDLTTGTVGNPTGTASEIVAYNVTPPANGDRATGISAIVVPQTFTGGSPLFRIRFGSVDYFYTPENNVVFAPGTKYNIQLTINQGQIDITSTVEQWADGGSIIGDGTIG